MIYLFNQTEELIDVIDEASLAEFTHTVELNQFDRSSFEIPVDYKPEVIKEAQFFGFQSRDRAFCLFRISEKSYDIGLTIEGIDRAESDLHSFIIEDKRPGGSADQVLSEILEGTGYQLGNTDGLTRTGRLSFYYISVRQALVKIIESYACEFKVRYTFVENKIIGRYIDLNQRFGRVTGHQFEYGSNILNVTYEESSDDVVTALIGRGKGEEKTNESGEATGGYGRRIQFKDVSWSVSRGDPVDKPAGQNYVSNEAARNIYGLHQNGVIKHRFGVYTNEDIEDPVELLKATYKELKRLSVPIVTFKANLLDLANAIEQDIWIGDSVGIVRDQIGIAFEARIHKLIIDKLDDNRSVVELGDYQTLQAKDRSTRQQAIKDAVSGFSEGLIEEAIANEVDRQNKEFDEKIRVNKLEFDNELQRAKERAEEIKRQISSEIDKKFQSFDNAAINEARRKAEEAIRNAGASTLLAQEAKRIGLDSVAKLEEFKRQATSAQTALLGDLDVLKRTIANDIRPKQAQAEAEISKQVEALVQTKKELAGVKSAQSTFEQSTTRRLSELTNLANGKASKSELTQTAEELTSKIASVQVGGRNLLRGSKGPFLPDRKPANFDNAILYVGQTSIYMEQGQEYIISAKTDGTFTAHHDGNKESDNVVLWIMDKDVRNYQIVSDLKTGTTGTKITWNKPTGIYHLRVNAYHKEATKSVWDVKIEKGNVATDWSPALEDIEGQISTVESNFRQRADALDAGVRSLTEGLRTKADISSLNVTAENIRQSVKSLETSTQNKLDQKLSMTEFEVRAGSIHQEILNATKDKADKTLVMTEAGKLREEFSNLRVGGTNLLKGSKGPFLPDRKPANFDNAILYAGNTSIYMEQGQEYIISAKTDGTFTAHHDGNKESDNVVLWIMDKDVRNYQIVSDLKTGTTGTKITWNKPTGIYHLRVNTYHKEATKSVWDVKIEKGNVATDWSPAPEDTDGLITEAKAIFERTAQGLRTDLSAIQDYVNKDGQRQETLQRYAREESAKQVTAVRELVTRDYVGKATYQEDVKGINQRIEAVKTSANKEIASQIASYRQSVDGKFTDISSQITTYKQDVGGQISGLSNRLTSSEQGTTTQISNLSNRINSNKQGTDNQISNLKTQVATNKANADSQFANVSNQLARKVETTDFQRVKETSQLYERILGNTENGIADKVARMAMTNQLFQVEVGKYGGGGPNLVKNSDFKDGIGTWNSSQNAAKLVKHNFYRNGQKDLICLPNSTQKELFLFSPRFELERNTDYVLNFRVFNNNSLTNCEVFVLGRRKDENTSFTIAKLVLGKTKFSTAKCEDVSVTFNSGEMDNAYIRFDNNGSSSGTADLYITEVDLYKGYKPRPWQPAPEDVVTDANAKLEAIRTQMTLLQGSWAIQNLTSAGSIVSQINATNNQILIEAEKIRLKGKTLLDELTAIQGYFKRLFVGEGTFATLNADVIRTNSITADKLVMDMAMARRFVSSDLFTDTLAAKEAFINKLRSVVVTATLLEGFQGLIGGFRFGQYPNRNGYFITGISSVSVGMGNGTNAGANRNAFWANWGESLDTPGPKAWYVNTDGKMYCRNEATFHSKVDFSSISNPNFYSKIKAHKGVWVGTDDVNGEGDNPDGGYNRVVWWSQIVTGKWRQYAGITTASDKKLKENIESTPVRALDKINALNLVAFDYIKDKTHEEIGLIAQEVQDIIPSAVLDDGNDSYLSIQYSKFVPYLIKAVQELHKKIEKLEKIA